MVDEYRTRNGDHCGGADPALPCPECWSRSQPHQSGLDLGLLGVHDWRAHGWIHFSKVLVYISSSSFNHRCTVGGKSRRVFVPNSFEGVLGIVRKSRGVPFFVFRCIFMTNFLGPYPLVSTYFSKICFFPSLAKFALASLIL